jgi:dipeptidyl aminopeptidase/acylaminoacyl peptidase
MITQRRGTVWSGRVAADGRTVVYGAAWDGQRVEVFATTDRDRGEYRPLGHGDADVFAVSASGELALALHRRFFQGRESTGTLARAPLGGGAAREVLDDVRDAEYLPDGDLLVVREEEGRVRLRRLSGEVIFETPTGWLSHVRASPDGRRLAFLVNPIRRDNRGKLVIFDMGRKAVVAESEEWPIVEGVAWHPAGKEVWYTPIRRVRAMSLGGKDRAISSFPAQVRLLHVDGEGRVLLAQELSSWGIRGLLADMPREKELSWLDQSYVADVSADGRALLFTEYGASEQYGVFFRKTASSPAVSLGDGAAMSLSPDGGTALAIRFGPPPQVVLLPTGTGSPRTLSRGPLEAYVSGAFFPDGARVLLWASEKGKGLRYWVQDLAGGAPRPVTPEGVSVQADANPITPDGKFVAASVNGAPMALYPVEGGEPRPAAGVERGEQALRFHVDGRLFVAKNVSPPPIKVTLVDVVTGARTPARELQPDDLAGVGDASNVVVSPDGSAYAYSYLRTLSTVYLARGLK